MAHIDSYSNGIYTSLAYNETPGALSTMDTQAELITKFATAPAVLPSIREFPEFGNPSNIVNVPVYGQKTSSQVSGQADQNTMEFTINYVPADLVGLMPLIGDGQLYAFQIALCNVKPTNLLQTATTGIATGSVQNTVFNFAGKFESFTVTPSLTDAYTAKITLSMATELFGPVTYA
jgi:hypothetical protein